MKLGFLLGLPLLISRGAYKSDISHSLSCAYPHVTDKCLHQSLKLQLLMLCSPAHERRSPSCQGQRQMSGKSNINPLEMKEKLRFYRDKKQSLPTPTLADAPTAARIDKPKGRLCFCGFEGNNNGDTKVFMSLHSHPACQHPQGKHMDLFTTRKSLHSYTDAHSS